MKLETLIKIALINLKPKKKIRKTDKNVLKLDVRKVLLKKQTNETSIEVKKGWSGSSK